MQRKGSRRLAIGEYFPGCTPNVQSQESFIVIIFGLRRIALIAAGPQLFTIIEIMGIPYKSMRSASHATLSVAQGIHLCLCCHGMLPMNPIDRLYEKLSDKSQQQVADELGISPQYLNDILHYRRKPGPLVLDALGIEKKVIYTLKRTPKQ